jgi:hypothetical protein
MSSRTRPPTPYDPPGISINTNAVPNPDQIASAPTPRVPGAQQSPHDSNLQSAFHLPAAAAAPVAQSSWTAASAAPASVDNDAGLLELKNFSFPLRHYTFKDNSTKDIPIKEGPISSIGLLLKEIFVLGSPDMRGNRESFEKLLGTTKSQMVLSGIGHNERLKIKATEASELEEFKKGYLVAAKKFSGAGAISMESIDLEIYVRQEEEELAVLGRDEPIGNQAITRRATERREVIDRLQKKLLLFKKYISWLTSVKMPRIDIIKDGAEMRKLIINEDEHVLPFGFMLTFGGRLGGAPKPDATRHLSYTALNDMIINMGRDFSQISLELSDKTCVDLARAMGFNELGMIYFFENMFDLKFEGMYFSEKLSNQIKSNAVFLKLNFVPLDKNNHAAGGTYIFQPSEHRIDEFCEMINIYKESIDSNKISGLQKKMMRSLQDEHSSSSTFYNKEKYVNKFFIDGWQNIGHYYNKDAAKNTMMYILNKLCENLNKYLPHRLFFNLVMNKVLINRAKKKEHKSQFRSLGAQPNRVSREGDRFASGLMRTDADRTFVEAAAAQRRGSMSRSNTAMSRSNSVAPSFSRSGRSSAVQVGPSSPRRAKRPRPANSSSAAARTKKPSKKRKHNKEDIENEYIRFYYDDAMKSGIWKQSYIDGNLELQEVFNQVKLPDAPLTKPSHLAHVEESSDSGSDSGSDSEGSALYGGGNKNKAKRKKKTRRKNKKKYKKKTRKKR